MLADPEAPVVEVAADDGVRLAAWHVRPAEPLAAAPGGSQPAARPGRGPVPLLLVHGTGSDHTTWRITGPPLAATGRPVYALDRRGRGGSGDGPAWAIAREVADVARVAEALAARHRQPVAILGHSLGGRLAIAATTRTGAVARVAAWEGAPTPHEARGEAALIGRLRALLERGDQAGVLATFLAEAAGLPVAELEAFRASPLWAVRVALAPTIVRELDAALHDPSIALEALAGAPVPVLQLVGSASPAPFRDGARALHARLADARLEVVHGARHNGTHTHASAIAAALDRFLGG